MRVKSKTVFILTFFTLLLVGILWVLKSIPEENQDIQEVKTEVEKTRVGGDRDEHGCIGSAGYRFDEEIGACLRDWELDENQKKAAKIGVEVTGMENSTVIEVLTSQCPGCFTVTLEAGKNRLKVKIQDWLAVEQSMTPEECLDQGGRTLNITGGLGCEAGEEEIGEVTGFISPNICCKVISK